MSKQRRSKKRRTEAAPSSPVGDMTRPRTFEEPTSQANTEAPGPTSSIGPAEGPGLNHEQITVRAYELWETRGRLAGTD